MVSIAQLRTAGLGDGAIKWRVRQGRLHRVHRGVYAVGHARLTDRGRMWAAVLACGGPGEAALSHWAAAALWDLCRLTAGRIDVTTRGGNRSTKAIRAHWGDLEEVTTVEGLSVTTVMRTLRDLATTTTQHRVNRLTARAEHLRLLDTIPLTARSKPGGRRLDTALSALARNEPGITRSELEARFLELVARAGLPPPKVNQIVEVYEVDFFWPDAKLVVETDGAATHLTPTAFENDRRRDQRLVAAGYAVVRFTWRQVTWEPEACAQALRSLLT